MADLTFDEIEKFVAAWFRALDFHVPVEECYKLVADEELHMQFPDGDIRDFESFKKWYVRVTNLFFDENHNVQSVEGKINGNKADLDVVVGWQASLWEPPSPKSKHVSMDATQKWTVRRSRKNSYGLEIATYNATAQPFKYAPGFARL